MPGTERPTIPLAQTLEAAASAYTSNEWDKAERLCRTILQVQPDSFEALNLLGIIKAQTRRPEEAADLLKRAVAVRPGDAAAHSNYGAVLGELGAALESYDRLISLQPDNGQAHYNRGVILQELNRTDEALESYARAVRLDPHFAAAYYNQGVALHRLRRFEEAVHSFDRALEIAPGFYEAANNRGTSLQELGRYDEALASLVPYQAAVV